jgi:hypothetical protein
MIERHGDARTFDRRRLTTLTARDARCVDAGERDERDGIDRCADGVIGAGVGDDAANSEAGGDDDVRERGGVRGVGDVCGVHGRE